MEGEGRQRHLYPASSRAFLLSNAEMTHLQCREHPRQTEERVASVEAKGELMGRRRSLLPPTSGSLMLWQSSPAPLP